MHSTNLAPMVRLYMIAFVYKHFTYYANVVENIQVGPAYYVSILSTRTDIPRKLIFVQKPGGLELSTYSLPANNELVNAIAARIEERRKTQVA
jgi:hypothetical protein